MHKLIGNAMIKKLKFITRITLVICFVIISIFINLKIFSEGNETQTTLIILWDVIVLMKIAIWAWE